MGQMEARIIDLITIIAHLLEEQKSTLSTAESCTGGSIAAACTSIAGASAWFHTGVVTYTRESKEQVLHIPIEELYDGLVTERCARAMASGIAQLSGSHFSLSTTGVCGPAESEGHAPCTAWIAVARAGKVIATHLHQSEDEGRSRNIQKVVCAALQQLLKALQDDTF